MRKVFMIFAVMALMISTYAVAELPITKVDKVNPNDEIFMDMALTAAKESLKEGGLPCGAVVILNGALRSAGQPTDVATAEETAIATSRRKSLKNAVIYTINEPTTEVYNLICSKSADAIYFVNTRDVVVAKGIYPAEAYDDAKIDSTLTQVPMMQMDFREAASFINAYNK